MSAGHFDQIVIGGGSAGCVVASRLSEDAGRGVLLLEAGGEATRREIAIPAAFFRLLRSEVDWAFECEGSPALNGRGLYWPRGRVLGGCSSINAMIYMRGHRTDFDGWAEQTDPRWGYDSVLERFRRSEDQERGRNEYHGVGGPLSVSDQRSPRAVSRAFVDAAVAHGLQRNDDFNGPDQAGAGLYQVTQRRGTRASTDRAFLAAARPRANLTVQTRCQVLRLILDGGKVTGVEYLRDGQKERAFADEVVLCAGAIGSPHLLMQSGVGAAPNLESAGITVRHELVGVGAHLMDHPVVPVTFNARGTDTLVRAETSTWELAKYLIARRGMLTSNVAEAGAFLRLRDSDPAPSVQFHFAPAFLLNHGFSNPPGHGLTCGVTLVRPRSTGRILPGSPDPTQPPRILPAYLSEADELADMVQGIRIARQVMAGEALKPFSNGAHLPPADAESDEELTAHVREWAQTLYHPTSTCRMGTDAAAVVDPRLRVHGLDGLRIADASIMPSIVNCNTNAATIMIGEMAADLIGSP